MTWTLLREKHAHFQLGMARSSGRCTAHECGETATEVVDFGGGRLAAYCTPCRRAELGSTPNERRTAGEKTLSLFGVKQ